MSSAQGRLFTSGSPLRNGVSPAGSGSVSCAVGGCQPARRAGLVLPDCLAWLQLARRPCLIPKASRAASGLQVLVLHRLLFNDGFKRHRF